MAEKPPLQLLSTRPEFPLPEAPDGEPEPASEDKPWAHKVQPLHTQTAFPPPAPKGLLSRLDESGVPIPVKGDITPTLVAKVPAVDLVQLTPGERVPGTRYRLLRWLGDGGMGVVYEAEHIDLDRKVALKILRPQYSHQPRVAELFRNEARTVSRLGSDFIVEVLDFDELPDGRLMFTMELLEATTLRSELETGSIDQSRTIAILRQICKALAAAHDAGVIHRDIKPDNVALTHRAGRADAVKLLDFGVSAVVMEATAGTATRGGTAYYVAPEIIAGLPHDGRADIYAVGCTAYEMLVGKPPFVGDLEDVLNQHLDEKPRPLAEAAEDQTVHPKLEAVVNRCLEKISDDRYRDARDLEAALCEAQIAAKLSTTWDDLPIPEVDPDRRERLLKAMPDPSRAQSRRSWLLPAVAGVSLVAALGLGYLQITGPATADAEQIQVTELVAAAQAAAARNDFIYPPPDRPDQPTALSLVIKLEMLGGARSPGKQRAKQLRTQFAETLIRLGDKYWDREGGKGFAIDYYAAALMFDIGNERAGERARMTPGQLAALREKAESQKFTNAELEATEPLAVLADADPDSQRAKLDEMRSRGSSRAVSTDEQLEKLVEESPDDSGLHASRRTKLRDKHADGDLEGARDSAAAPSEAKSPARKSARKLVAEGEAALKRGQHSRAKGSFERALAINPKNAAALGGLSRIAFHAGSYAKAAKLGERAVKLAPNNPDYRLRLGDAYYKVFRYGDAQAQYQKAQALGHQAAKRRLAKVEAKRGG